MKSRQQKCFSQVLCVFLSWSEWGHRAEIVFILLGVVQLCTLEVWWSPNCKANSEC